MDANKGIKYTIN